MTKRIVDTNPMKCQGCGCYVTPEQADSAPRVTGFTTLCETCAEGLGPEKAVPPDGSHHGEHSEFVRVRERIDELMSGGPIGDGIGPGNTAYRINEEFGTSYQGQEVWRIWRLGKEWAKPQDDTYPL